MAGEGTEGSQHLVGDGLAVPDQRPHQPAIGGPVGPEPAAVSSSDR